MVPYGQTEGDDGQLLLQARQGSPEAIAQLLNRALNPRGIGARVYTEAEGLVVWLESMAVPPQAEMVTFIQQGLSQLAIANLERVRVVGGKPGLPTNDYAWQEAIRLSPGAQPPPIQANAALPITQFEVGHEGATGPCIAYADKVLYPSSHGVVVMQAPAQTAGRVRARPAPNPLQSCLPVDDAIGREAELEGAIAALKTAQPVAFYGASGLGKTTLLRLITHHPMARQRYPDGIVYRHGQSQSLADLLASLFDAFFEYDAPLPRKPTLDQIQQSFQRRQALVVLDDVELSPSDLKALIDPLKSLNFVVASAELKEISESFTMPLGGLDPAEALTFVEQCLGRTVGADERPAAEALCQRLHGVPLRLRQAIALVANRHLTLAKLAQYVSTPTPLENLLLRSCAALPEAERRILAALGVIGAVAIRTQHIAGLTGNPTPQSALDALIQRGLLTSDGTQHTLAENLVQPLREHWNLTPWVQPVVNYFMDWARKNAQEPNVLALDGSLLLGVMRRAAEHQRWSEVLQGARLLDGAFVLSGQWDRWRDIWQLALQAGQALGEQAAIAQAYHQLGTRALCLNDTLTAHTYLTQATQLRQALGNTTAASTSHHNLQWLLPAPGQQSQPGGAIATTTAPVAPVAAGTAPYPPEAVAPFSAQTAYTEAEPQGIPAIAQVALVATLFLGLGGFLAFQMNQNRPGVAVTPDRLEFGSQERNKTSAPQTLTLQNNGEGLLELIPLSPSGTHPTDFQITADDCGQKPLLPTETCTAQITFTPQAEGSRTAEVLVSNRTRSFTQRIELTGDSPAVVEAGPITLSFQPGNLDFGDYNLNQQSDFRRIVLRNESNQPVTIQAISPVGDASADFPTNHDCTGAPLIAGQSCSINIAFRPSLAGQRTANLAVSDTANNLWNVPIRGNGLSQQPQDPALSLRPGSLNFGEIQVAQFSPEQIVTVSNTGNQALTVSNVSLETDNGFSLRRNTCTREPLQPNGSCSIGLVFSPQAAGEQSGELIIDSNDPRGNARIYLGGSGIIPAVSAIGVTPSQLDFGTIELENASRPQTVTLRNTGNEVLTIGSIQATGNGDFISANDGQIGANCANSPLQPGQVCRFEVVFLPYVEGDRAAQLTITSNAPQGAIAIPLQGQGLLERFATLSVSPSNLSFGSYAVGGSSPPQNLTLINSGGAPLTLRNLTIGGMNANDFSPSSDSSLNRIQCSNITLQPGENCGLQIFFNPIGEGDRRAFLLIPSNDPNGDLRVNFNGLGTVVPPQPQPRVD